MLGPASLSLMLALMMLALVIQAFHNVFDNPWKFSLRDVFRMRFFALSFHFFLLLAAMFGLMTLMGVIG